VDRKENKRNCWKEKVAGGSLEEKQKGKGYAGEKRKYMCEMSQNPVIQED